jgi:AcrR family transcriptional regulator
MPKKNAYHHGNLRRVLIEKGLEFVSKQGEDRLSLRKLAQACGVSVSAPYAHFADKEDLLNAMQGHVMAEFTAVLEQCRQRYSDDPKILMKMGVAYVLFFYDHPYYFDFLFSRDNLTADLTLAFDEPEEKNTNTALYVFKDTAREIFHKTALPEEIARDLLVGMLALVQGLSSIFRMPNVRRDTKDDRRIEEKIENILLLMSPQPKSPAFVEDVERERR